MYKVTLLTKNIDFCIIMSMTITRGYRAKLYPNRSQEQILLRHIGACRFVYNHFLDKKKTTYLETGKNITYLAMSKELTKLRHETEWMQSVQFQPLQQSLRSLDVAYNRFFRKQAQFPNFHKKDGKQSMRKVTGWSITGNHVKIMDGVSVRFRGAFPTKREATLTISRDTCGSWWASTIATEERKTPKLKGAIGVDLGLNHLAVTSDGEKYDNERSLGGSLARIRSASKNLSKKQKGGANRRKAKTILARLHLKVANKRKNRLHHVSKEIVGKNHAMIALEDLSVKNMMTNRRLSRSIADVGWGELVRQIGYKQEWNGGETIKIDRFFPSSKTCSSCYFVIGTLPLSAREWTCPKCEMTHGRDENAAKNILKQAGELLDMEGKALARADARTKPSPVKYEYVQG